MSWSSFCFKHLVEILKVALDLLLVQGKMEKNKNAKRSINHSITQLFSYSIIQSITFLTYTSAASRNPLRRWRRDGRPQRVAYYRCRGKSLLARSFFACSSPPPIHRCNRCVSTPSSRSPHSYTLCRKHTNLGMPLTELLLKLLFS